MFFFGLFAPLIAPNIAPGQPARVESAGVESAGVESTGVESARVEASALGPVSGSVLRVDGGPLEGTVVELAPMPANGALMRALAARQPRAHPVATARTDDRGRFRLLPPGAGVYQVSVRAPGHLAMWYLLLPVADRVELPPVTLVPAVRADIRVRDPEGAHRADIAIFAESADPGRWRRTAPGGWRPALRIGWSDDDGMLTLPRGRGEEVVLRVLVPGVAQMRRHAADEGFGVVVGPPRRGPRSLMVRENDGSPIDGAMVAFADGALPIAESDTEGRVTLAGTDDRPVDLLLFTRDGRYRKVTYRAPPADDAPPTELRFPPSVRLTGRVMTAAADGREGAPIADAVVWPTHDPGLAVVTDDDGRFDLLAASRETIRLQAHAADHAPSMVSVPVERVAERGLAGPAGGVIRLHAASDLEGVVVDESGSPVSGAHLMAVRTDARKTSVFRLDPVDGRATSDRQGRFRIASLASDQRYSLRASKRGHVMVDAIEAADSVRPVRLVLARGRPAFGRVVDRDDRPVAGADIRLRVTGGELEGVTDEHGRFEIRRLSNASADGGRLDIAARAPGFAPMTVRGVEIPAGDKAVDLGTLVLEPGVSIEGRVTDPSGEPIADAEVWVLAEAAASPWLLEARWARAPEPEADAVSDPRGRFEVVDLEPSRSVHLRIDAEGYLPTFVMAVASGERPGVNDAGEPDVEVVLEPAARLSGRVEDEEGGAVAGAEVSVEMIFEPEADESAGPTRSRLAKTDDRGRFEVDDIAPGRHIVDAFADGYQPSTSRTVALDVGAEPVGLRFVLRRGAVLTGTVSDGDGLPIEGAQVLVGRPSSRSDTGGAFRVAGLPLGAQRVDVRHSGYNRRVEEVDIAPGENHLDVTLSGGNRVSGRVIDARDLPVADAVVGLRRDADSPGRHRATSGEDGRFELPAVPDGRYFVVAEKAGFVSDRRAHPIEVVDGPVEDLEVVLLEGATLRGRVIGLDFDEMAQVTVRAEADGRPNRLGTVDFDGRYEVGDLAAGDWLVTAQLQRGSRHARARVTLASGQTEAERDLEFGGGVTLTGLVLFGGEPLADTRVQLRGRDVPVARAVTTGFEGRFEIAELDPGRYHLGLSHAGERLIHNQDLTVSADRDVVIEIDTAHLSGHITSATTGEPLERAVVSVREALGDGRSGSLFAVGSDAEGYFEVPRLSAGTYRLSVQLDGYEPAEQPLEVAAGSEIRGLVIALEPTDGLALSVRLGSGRRPRVVTVKALDPAGRPVMSQTRVIAEDGFARFASVPPGTWDLWVGARGGALVRTRASVPGEPVEVVLPDAGRLKVRVPALVESEVIGEVAIVGHDGRAFSRMGESGEIERRWPLAAGRALVENLPAGQWTVQAGVPDGRSWSGTVATTGGPDIVVDLRDP